MRILILLCAIVAVKAAKLQGYVPPNAQATTSTRDFSNPTLSSPATSSFSNSAGISLNQPLHTASGVPLPTISEGQFTSSTGQGFSAPQTAISHASSQPSTGLRAQSISYEPAQSFSRSSGQDLQTLSNQDHSAAFSGASLTATNQQVPAVFTAQSPAIHQSVRADHSFPDTSAQSNRFLQSSSGQSFPGTVSSSSHGFNQGSLTSGLQASSFTQPQPVQVSASQGFQTDAALQASSGSFDHSLTSAPGLVSTHSQPQSFQGPSTQFQNEQVQVHATSGSNLQSVSGLQGPAPSVHQQQSLATVQTTFDSSAPRTETLNQPFSGSLSRSYSQPSTFQVSGSPVPSISDNSGVSAFATSNQAHASQSIGASSGFPGDSRQSFSTSTNAGFSGIASQHSLATTAGAPTTFDLNRQVGSVSAQQVHGGGDCAQDEVRHVDGSCVKPEVTQNVFVYDAPKQERTISAVPQDLPLPKVEHNILFIRAPVDDVEEEPIIIPPPQMKNIIYVLNKDSEQEQRVIELPAPPARNPEVYFVNYAEGENPTLPDGTDFETALQSAVQVDSQVVEDTQVATSGSGNLIGGQGAAGTFTSDAGLSSSVDLRANTNAETFATSNVGLTSGNNFADNQNINLVATNTAPAFNQNTDFVSTGVASNAAPAFNQNTNFESTGVASNTAPAFNQNTNFVSTGVASNAAPAFNQNTNFVSTGVASNAAPAFNQNTNFVSTGVASNAAPAFNQNTNFVSTGVASNAAPAFNQNTDLVRTSIASNTAPAFNQNTNFVKTGVASNAAPAFNQNANFVSTGVASNAAPAFSSGHNNAFITTGSPSLSTQAREETFFVKTDSSEENFVDINTDASFGVPLPGLGTDTRAQGFNGERPSTRGEPITSRLYNAP